jgi:outer membrane protein insertion porin family
MSFLKRMRPNQIHRVPVLLAMLVICLLGIGIASPAAAQMGGMGGGPGGSGGPAGPGPDEKPKFRDHVHSIDGLNIRREKGDAVVAFVNVVGNQRVSTNKILQEIQTRKDRFYDYETVLSDIRRLNEMGAFDLVTFELDEQPGKVGVTYTVRERELITKVIMHGNRAMNERELRSRSGIEKNDPMSEFAIDSAKRRLLDYYHEEGFNQASIETKTGIANDPSAVVFRINEGPKERIADIIIEGATIVSEARLKKVITSRGPWGGVASYLGNTADLRKVQADVDVLAEYYHDLGFLTATVGHHRTYDETGKWLTVTYVVEEGIRYSINDIQIVGQQYVTEESIRNRLILKPGDIYDGKQHRVDVGEIVYGLGELGFAYAEVEPETIMLDEVGKVDLVYKVQEGDRWTVRNILVNIEGDPHLMRDSTVLNLVDLKEGTWVNLRDIEINRERLIRGNLFESNPQVADPPDIKVVPVGAVEERY